MKRGLSGLALIGVFFVAACGSIPIIGSGEEVSDGRRASAGGIYKIGTPYQIEGEWYYPQEDAAYVSSGVASWYGPKFHGRRTANGEIFNMNLLTAAHPTLPMPVRVRVTNLENDRSIIVRVNDRGPFKKNREIDLSRRAAEVLGFVEKGTTRVRVEYLGRAPLYDKSGRRIFGVEEETFITKKPITPADQRQVAAAPIEKVATHNLDGGPVSASSQAVPSKSLYTVQLGVFSSLDSAKAIAAQVSNMGQSEIIAIERDGRPLYRVVVGGANIRTMMEALVARLEAAGYADAFITKP
jgi:rare lipoprotein A